MERIVKYARRIDIGLMISRRVMIVSFVIVAIMMPYAILQPEAFAYLLESTSREIGFASGSLKLTLTGLPTNADSLRGVFIVLLVFGSALFAAFLYIIKHLRAILAQVKEMRPSSPDIASRIRKLAVAFFTVSYLQPLSVVFFNYYFSSLYDFQPLIASSDLIVDISMNAEFNLDPMVIFACFIVYLLSLVFEYGAQLQQASDETL